MCSLSRVKYNSSCIKTKGQNSLTVKKKFTQMGLFVCNIRKKESKKKRAECVWSPGPLWIRKFGKQTAEQWLEIIT